MSRAARAQADWTPRESTGKPIKITQKLLHTIWRAQLLYDKGDYDACEPIVRDLIKQGMGRALTYDALGSCIQYSGRMGDAIKYFRKALEVDPDYVQARDRIIMILDALPETTPEQAARERALWWKRHGVTAYAHRRPPLGDRNPDRPIRVGYVSADFQFHSAASVFHRVVTQHSEQIQPFLYSSTKHNKWDQITNTYRAMPGWRDVVDWPDLLLVDKIRDDKIDILVDLSSFTADNRLPAFAYKPAPIQITGFGYALATGFPCFDGVLTDRVVTPPGTSEGDDPVYIPCVISYERQLNPDGTEGYPPANPLPCLTERPTFGVFQRSLKINTRTIALWRRILERLPEARLILKSVYSPKFQAWVREEFGAQAAQLEIRPVATSSYAHKLAYGEVDLCLDPFPQTAGVSGCDALYMGVPMVTLMGSRAIQRTSGSLLTNVGLTGFMANSGDEYVDLAVSWVTDRKHELAGIRHDLRDRFLASPICAGYTEAVEAAYRHCWREYCAKPMPIADAQFRLREALAS